jgi:glutamyl/glutaminyl-tRNA synthetase
MYHTRFAPSPTGDFHLGSARTAYFNWLAARSSGGKFLLRIDDTDLARNSDAAVDMIYTAMDWLGLDYDGVYRQSDRLDLYRAAADNLVKNHLAKVADNGAVILNMSAGNMSGMGWVDTISGIQLFTPDVIKSLWDRDIVLMKGDGMPTYHFASVVDDVDLGINWVIRGIDHFTNTFVHTMIGHAMGAPFPLYAHVGLIMKDKKKLSKRDAASSLLGYRDAGYDRDAVLNFILRMGWGPTVDDKTTAVLNRDDALRLFCKDGKMRAAPSNFDQMKLDSFDRKYKGRKEHPARVG